ncbi:SDR family NAD(P)-dependent oxidoreductase [Catenovulum sediminis]|uniref:SDR family oxidoreductase n=1 Tax=Catenovulum sediminis TaxID=1740262 RepID=A0ABV1RH08_9ALTE
MDLNLTGKNILITGASRGIGAAIAEAFLREGSNVFLLARGMGQLLETQSRLKAQYKTQLVKSFVADCSAPTELEKVFESLNNSGVVIDSVVANVGDGRSVPDPLPTKEQWQVTWSNNFEVALNTAQCFLPMLQKSKGSLCFVSSIAGLESIGAPVDYSTAKTAILSLSKNMARKLEGEVRVNSIAPGNIYFPGGSWEEKIKKDKSLVDSVLAGVPMKRFGKASEVADAVVFICSDKASFINGSVLVVDGGQTLRVG